MPERTAVDEGTPHRTWQQPRSWNGPKPHVALERARRGLASEWIKMLTLRSMVWSLIATFVIGAGLAYALAAGFRSDLSHPGLLHSWDPIFGTFYSLSFAQLPLVAFGVMLVGSEYSSSTIRASLVAVPCRGLLYVFKIAAGAGVAFGVSCATAVATFFAAETGLGPFGIHLSSPGALQGLVGSILYLTLMCLLAAGLAMLLRSSALSLGILLPFLLLESQGLGNVPQLKGVMEYLPANAGMVIMHIYGQDRPGFAYPYGPWAGIGILAVWTAAALLAGWLSFRMRDA